MDRSSFLKMCGLGLLAGLVPKKAAEEEVLVPFVQGEPSGYEYMGTVTYSATDWSTNDGWVYYRTTNGANVGDMMYLDVTGNAVPFTYTAGT